MTYVHVRLANVNGERWTYQPPADHDVAWLAMNAGRLHTAGVVLERELAVFAEGNIPIELRAEGQAEFVIRSARAVILRGMTHRVGAKGQVVIPKQLRDELGIEPGDEVTFWRDDDHVALRPAHPRAPLRGRFQAAGLSDVLAAERLADRRRER